MKINKPLVLSLLLIDIFVLSFLFLAYVYIGTYVFPIAPYWVTQLPPNPPKPIIKHGEFDFKFVYSINDTVKEVSDTLVCDFVGFEVISIGSDKTRVWTETLKNTKGNELFHFRDEERKNDKKEYSAICIENIGKYKVVVDLPKAEWFLNEPGYSTNPNMPYIQIYDTETRFYLFPEERDGFLEEIRFKVIEWSCDEPLQNTFR